MYPKRPNENGQKSLYQSRNGFIYIPTVLDTKKKPFSGTEIPKKGIKQGLSRSIADFASPYLLCEIAVCRTAARRGVNLAV